VYVREPSVRVRYLFREEQTMTGDRVFWIVVRLGELARRPKTRE
jgi:hypothetical protein